MSTFWVVASALTLFVVALLAVPLLRRARTDVRAETDTANIALYRDQLAELERDCAQGTLSAEQFEQAKLELGQRLLVDVPESAQGEGAHGASAARGAWRFVALAAVPIASVLGYLALGTPDAVDSRLTAAKAGGGSEPHMQDLPKLVERLAVRLESNPEDAEAWVLLARSNHMLRRPVEAAKAYAKAVELVPGSAQLWADYADMQVASANGEWTPGAKEALTKALSLDPAHPKALWLAGSEALVRRDYRTALKYWEELAPLAEPGSEAARAIQANIVEARSLAGAEKGVSPTAPPVKDGAAEGKGPQAKASPAKPQAVSGTVALDSALAARVKPADTVFVFARAAQGPKVPLAIRRISVQDLPYVFSLDDSAAMAPGMTISAFDQIIVGARVSRSGDAVPKPGDFEGLSAPVKPGAVGIQVVINAEIR